MRDVRQVAIDIVLPCDADEEWTARVALRIDADAQELPVVCEGGQVLNAYAVVRDGVRVTCDAMSGLGEIASGVALRLVSPEHTASPGQQRQADQAHDAPEDDEGDAPNGRASLCWVDRHFDSP